MNLRNSPLIEILREITPDALEAAKTEIGLCYNQTDIDPAEFIYGIHRAQKDRKNRR